LAAPSSPKGPVAGARRRLPASGSTGGWTASSTPWGRWSRARGPLIAGARPLYFPPSSTPPSLSLLHSLPPSLLTSLPTSSPPFLPSSLPLPAPLPYSLAPPSLSLPTSSPPFLPSLSPLLSFLPSLSHLLCSPPSLPPFLPSFSLPFPFPFLFSLPPFLLSSLPPSLPSSLLPLLPPPSPLPSSPPSLSLLRPSHTHEYRRGCATERERGPCVRESASDCLAPAEAARSSRGASRRRPIAAGRGGGERAGAGTDL